MIARWPTGQTCRLILLHDLLFIAPTMKQQSKHRGLMERAGRPGSLSDRLPGLVELDRTSFPRWRDRIARAEAEHEAGGGVPALPRGYPGHPWWQLPRVRRRVRPSLDSALTQRRSTRELATVMLPISVLARLLWFGHGAHLPTDVHAGGPRGPVPSAGGLQALELYLAIFESGWLPAGFFHYDRVQHGLALVAPAVTRLECERDLVPALATVAGGAFLWILVGDGARVQHKYGERAARFLVLEAGHLMQNLCLLSSSLGLATVPLGGFYERALASHLALLPGDLVLYAGVCGKLRA